MGRQWSAISVDRALFIEGSGWVFPGPEEGAVSLAIYQVLKYGQGEKSGFG